MICKKCRDRIAPCYGHRKCRGVESRLIAAAHPPYMTAQSAQTNFVVMRKCGTVCETDDGGLLEGDVSV